MLQPSLDEAYSSRFVEVIRRLMHYIKMKCGRFHHGTPFTGLSDILIHLNSTVKGRGDKDI